MKWTPHCMAALLGLLTVPGQVFATDVNVVGLFPGKAIVVVNHGAPRTLTAGEATPEGVRLVSSTSSQAVLEIDGKRRTLEMGQSVSVGGGAGAANPTVTLTADGQGHFLTVGSINGVSARFLVDTGASYVSLNSQDARRMGLDYTKGERGSLSTANGVVGAWRVTLDRVQVGAITLNQVDGVVTEGGSPPLVLLGMSFLNRVAMKRDGDRLVLTKRY